MTKYERWLNIYNVCLHSLHSHLRECLILPTQRKHKKRSFNLQTSPKKRGKSLSLYSVELPKRLCHGHVRVMINYQKTPSISWTGWCTLNGVIKNTVMRYYYIWSTMPTVKIKRESQHRLAGNSLLINHIYQGWQLKRSNCPSYLHHKIGQQAAERCNRCF